MAEVDTSIYRQPPQQNPLQQLTQIGQAADSLGGIAAGQAVQGAMGPDGQIDRNQLAHLLTQSVAGSMKAIPTLNALEQLKSAGFAADQAGLETFQKRMAITSHLFSGLASKDKPGKDDVYDVAARALDPALEAKKYGITLPVVMNALKAFKTPDGKWLPAAEIKKKALEIQTQAASTSEILHQHSPGMQAIDRNGNIEFVPTGTLSSPAVGTVVPKNLPPTTQVVTPQGTQLLGEQPAPPPAAVAPGARPARGAPPVAPAGGEPLGSPSAPRPVGVQPITPTGPTTALRPGLPEAMTAVAGASAGSAVNLIQSNDTSQQRKALLGNLDDLIGKFTPGTGADWSLVAKNFANRNLPVPESWQKAGGVLDIKSVASQEEFNKLAEQLAQQQFAALGGTGTDAKFGSAFKTSPNELMSTLGNKNVIRLLKGNEDAIQAKAKAARKYMKDNGADSYPDFSQEFNDHFDPRAFQFKYMDSGERNDYLKGMEPEERARFLHDLTYARKEKWITFDQPK